MGWCGDVCGLMLWCHEPCRVSSPCKYWAEMVSTLSAWAFPLESLYSNLFRSGPPSRAVVWVVGRRGYLPVAIVRVASCPTGTAARASPGRSPGVKTVRRRTCGVFLMTVCFCLGVQATLQAGLHGDSSSCFTASCCRCACLAAVGTT